MMRFSYRTIVIIQIYLENYAPYKKFKIKCLHRILIFTYQCLYIRVIYTQSIQKDFIKFILIKKHPKLTFLDFNYRILKIKV